MNTNTRRTFLKHAGAGLALAASAPSLRAAGANEDVRLGLIGCGIRGKSFYPYVSYVCDPDERRLATAVEKSGVSSSQATTDFRRILDDPSIDAVVIATPDHWHAPAAILACEAGKHVYVEKPVSHNFRESQLLQQAAERAGVVVQHGTQQRSNPFIAEAVQMVHEGQIGDVLVAKAWNVQKRDNIGFASPTPPPAEVDYEQWVGPAEYVPFQKNRFHTDWHWWYNFGTGDIGNDGTHEIDYARWGLGLETLPSRITGLGGKYYFDDQQQFPDTATCVFEYPGEGSVGDKRQLIFELRLWSTNYPINTDSGVEFYGTKGQMTLSKRGKLRVLDADNKLVVNERAEKQAGFPHLQNFLEAVRGNAKLAADLRTAHLSVGLVHLANIALRTERTLNFDPDKEAIVGDDQASQLLTRQYRESGHWAIPKNV